MSESWRPPFCPDRTCTPLIRPLTDSDNRDLAQPGFAVFCFGQLAEPIDWTFAGVEHHETLSQCQMSPLKGNVRWLDNLADWEALASVYRMAADRARVAGAAPETPRDPLSPQWEDCKVCGGDHWTKDHHDHCDPRAHKSGAAPETREPTP